MSVTWKVIEGDCLEVLRAMEPESIDYAITDPPYGLSIGGSGRIGGSSLAEVGQYAKGTWDDNGLSVEQWKEIRRVSKHQIVWGYNALSDTLGPCRGMLVWDKKCQNGWLDNFSDVEAAWCSVSGPDRCFRHLWMGALRSGEPIRREHPTQKPVELMDWCLRHLGVKAGETVIDPFCGSGTTGVSCVKNNVNFLGVEQSPAYVSIARRRISEAANHLFAGGAA